MHKCVSKGKKITGEEITDSKYFKYDREGQDVWTPVDMSTVYHRLFILHSSYYIM